MFDFDTSVGEDPEAPKEYNGRWSVPTAVALRICGTAADFAGAGVYDATAVPPVRRPDGLPACCGWIQAGSGCCCGTGEATVTYTPPTPEPGTDCPSAPELSLDTEYEWTIASGEAQWWKWQLAAGSGPWRLVSTNLAGVGLFDESVLARSNDCGTPNDAAIITADCQSTTLGGSQTTIAIGVSCLLVPRTYTFKLESGTCPP